ncbi:hypothetical protein Ais01nite_84420 [Asanoa ishikariensis]|uniref:Uncharacterized protein n=1 Tax=Asanoa ishikariensis TaxID=137265 RepID=A0A1H3KCU1_9ACTN|nr:hypothetical protein [Asanoa ishikariensis]GIF70407.1 hypothetical protein Ais01nite_84420 [Asanoa ishikariensis]SDY49966.1 hypothetical protein SAMN05421684_0073 [Asanoa ishikariensis]
MAVRGWGGSIAAAIGIAACAGAAQLGLGYGLGIITWLPASDRVGEAAWAASLSWAAWIAATSTVAGAIGAQRLTEAADTDDDEPPGATFLGRISLVVAAAVGALVTVALVAVPARAAVRADTFSPQTIAAGYAVIGVLLGLVFATWSLSSRAAASNVIATVGWLWLLAVVSVTEGVVSGGDQPPAQLGVWQITTGSDAFWFRDYLYWPGAALALGAAFVIGALVARRPARDPLHRVGAAVSGIAGPLVVASAYFLAAPRLSGIRAEQVSAHLLAPYAVLAGLAGSVLVTTLAQRADRSLVTVPTQRAHTDDPTREPATATANVARPEPTTGGDGTETARATPLWPEGTAPGETLTPKPERKRRFGRRNSSDAEDNA